MPPKLLNTQKMIHTLSDKVSAFMLELIEMVVAKMPLQLTSQDSREQLVDLVGSATSEHSTLLIKSLEKLGNFKIPISVEVNLSQISSFLFKIFRREETRCPSFSTHLKALTE
jgi:hypothetical protein